MNRTIMRATAMQMRRTADASATDTPTVILASGSRYRGELLKRLGLEFTTQPANIDETPKPSEPGKTLASRLSLEKARHVSLEHSESLVIGADQVAVILNAAGTATTPQPNPANSESSPEMLLGKPGNHERATGQLKAMRGRTVMYYSGLAMLGPGVERIEVVPTRLQMRNYSDDEIQRYLEHDQPWDCAGSMRSESLGISLVSELSSRDPSALIGLPLIVLSQWLRASGFSIP